MTKADEILHAKIMERINAVGKLPWDSGLLNYRPRNYVSGKDYKGENNVWLAFFGESESQEYVTFKQAIAKNGKVEKGTKMCPVKYFTLWNPKTRKEWKDGDALEDCKMLARVYYVMPIEKAGLKTKRPPIEEKHKIEDMECYLMAYMSNAGIKFTHRAGYGGYSPKSHAIHVAPITKYRTSELYYATLAHECVHSTMKAMKREQAEQSIEFGSNVYSEEEVVAEVGAWILCQRFHIEKQQDNNAVYLKSWSEKLQNNPQWLFKGIKAAYAAVEYMDKVVGGEDGNEG